MSDELLGLHMEQDKERFDAIDRQLALAKNEALKRMDSIDGKLDELIAAQNKQKGFISGVSMAFSMLAATIVSLIVYIWNSLR